MADPKNDSTALPQAADAASTLRLAVHQRAAAREATIKITRAEGNEPKVAKPKFDPNEKVRVRVKHGSLILGHRRDEAGNHSGQIVAHEGDIIELPRGEVEALLGRSFDGYGTNVNPNNGSIAVAQFPSPLPIRDTNIELLDKTG